MYAVYCILITGQHSEILMNKYLAFTVTCFFCFAAKRASFAQAPFTALQVQAKTVAGCTAPANSNTCSITLAWQHAFVDSSYSVVCTAAGLANQQSIPGMNDFSPVPFILTIPPQMFTTTQSTLVVTFEEAPGSQQIAYPATLPAVHCIAVHE